MQQINANTVEFKSEIKTKWDKPLKPRHYDLMFRDLVH